MIYLGIGIVAGILAGMFGIGGGIVIVPALISLDRMKVEMATGTSLAALLLPVGLLGAWEYYKKGLINPLSAVLIALGLFVGAWFGARLSLSISSRQLQRAFAVFLLLVAVQLWKTAGDKPAQTTLSTPDPSTDEPS